MNLTSPRLRTEQSEFITCLHYTNISVHKRSVCFLGNKKLTFPHVVESPNVDGREGSDISFRCVYNEISNVVYLKLHFFENLLVWNRSRKKGQVEMVEIFSNLKFMWVTKYLLTSYNFQHE